MDAHFPNMRPPLDLWHQNESGVVSNLDFQSWLVLHAKRGIVVFSTVFLEKRKFLQRALNIGKLYTIGNHFSPRI